MKACRRTKISTEFVHREVEKYWTQEINDYPEDPSIARALKNVSVGPYILACVISLFGNVEQFFGPLVLILIIAYLLDPTASLAYGLAFTLSIFIAQIANSISPRHSYCICCRVGIRVRTALVYANSLKSLRIDSTFYQEHHMGQVTNGSQALVESLFSCSVPILVAASSLGLYTIVGNHILDAATALTAMSVFNILKMPLLTVPSILNFGIESQVALDRIRTFLVAPDIDRLNNWPSEGNIEFKNYKLRYRSDLPLVLTGLDLIIPRRAKVGIVGAGKSTLIAGLSRLVELSEGKILLDGIDISTIGLTSLRSNIAIIPQDPVLFAGTIRNNLDQFGQHSEERLMHVLDRVGLSSSVKSLEDKVEQ